MFKYTLTSDEIYFAYKGFDLVFRCVAVALKDTNQAFLL